MCPVDALSGPPPRVQALDVRAEGLDPQAEQRRGFGFPVRVWDQDPESPIYLYSATISSIDRSDLTFEAVEPPFGTPIAPGCCRDVCLHAAAAGDGGPIFIANLLIQWGHTLPVGSDPQPGVLVQVLVEEGRSPEVWAGRVADVGRQARSPTAASNRLTARARASSRWWHATA